MFVYRIVHKKYDDPLFAPGFSGRWNGTGKKVLYCAESIPLAFMESMIRRQGVGFNHDYNIVIIEIPDDIKIRTVALSDLQEGWRNWRDYTICQQTGNTWYDGFEVPVLKVPSALIVECYNYVINTLHTEYRHIKVAGITELVPDARIDELLKKYKI
jgi:RES domain-containing protein